MVKQVYLTLFKSIPTLSVHKAEKVKQFMSLSLMEQFWRAKADSSNNLLFLYLTV